MARFSEMRFLPDPCSSCYLGSLTILLCGLVIQRCLIHELSLWMLALLMISNAYGLIIIKESFKRRLMSTITFDLVVLAWSTSILVVRLFKP
jgi:hypothetical protein